LVRRRGSVVDHDIQITDADGDAMGGLKMANGTNSIRTDTGRGWPGTRGKSAYLVRQQFMKAIEHQKKIEEAGDDPDKMPARDLHLETLIEVMSGKRIVHHHTHRHDDIMTVLRLADEFGFRVVLHHVSEGWVVADEIANYEGVPGPDGKPFGAPLLDHPRRFTRRQARGCQPGLQDRGGARAGRCPRQLPHRRLDHRLASVPPHGRARRACGHEPRGGVAVAHDRGGHQMDLADRVGS
jgi:imidazolonepropionase-like amidohydrolase